MVPPIHPLTPGAPSGAPASRGQTPGGSEDSSAGTLPNLPTILRESVESIQILGDGNFRSASDDEKRSMTELLDRIHRGEVIFARCTVNRNAVAIYRNSEGKDISTLADDSLVQLFTSAEREINATKIHQMMEAYYVAHHLTGDNHEEAVIQHLSGGDAQKVQEIRDRLQLIRDGKLRYMFEDHADEPNLYFYFERRAEIIEVNGRKYAAFVRVRKGETRPPAVEIFTDFMWTLLARLGVNIPREENSVINVMLVPGMAGRLGVPFFARLGNIASYLRYRQNIDYEYIPEPYREVINSLTDTTTIQKASFADVFRRLQRGDALFAVCGRHVNRGARTVDSHGVEKFILEPTDAALRTQLEAAGLHFEFLNDENTYFYFEREEVQVGGGRFTTFVRKSRTEERPVAVDVFNRFVLALLRRAGIYGPHITVAGQMLTQNNGLLDRNFFAQIPLPPIRDPNLHRPIGAQEVFQSVGLLEVDPDFPLRRLLANGELQLTHENIGRLIDKYFRDNHLAGENHEEAVIQHLSGAGPGNRIVAEQLRERIQAIRNTDASKARLTFSESSATYRGYYLPPGTIVSQLMSSARQGTDIRGGRITVRSELEKNTLADDHPEFARDGVEIVVDARRFAEANPDLAYVEVLTRTDSTITDDYNLQQCSMILNAIVYPRGDPRADRNYLSLDLYFKVTDPALRPQIISQLEPLAARMRRTGADTLKLADIPVTERLQEQRVRAQVRVIHASPNFPVVQEVSDGDRSLYISFHQRETNGRIEYEVVEVGSMVPGREGAQTTIGGVIPEQALDYLRDRIEALGVPRNQLGEGQRITQTFIRYLTILQNAARQELSRDVQSGRTTAELSVGVAAARPIEERISSIGSPGIHAFLVIELARTLLQKGAHITGEREYSDITLVRDALQLATRIVREGNRARLLALSHKLEEEGPESITDAERNLWQHYFPEGDKRANFVIVALSSAASLPEIGVLSEIFNSVTLPGPPPGAPAEQKLAAQRPFAERLFYSLVASRYKAVTIDNDYLGYLETTKSEQRINYRLDEAIRRSRVGEFIFSSTTHWLGLTTDRATDRLSVDIPQILLLLLEYFRESNNTPAGWASYQRLRTYFTEGGEITEQLLRDVSAFVASLSVIQDPSGHHRPLEAVLRELKGRIPSQATVRAESLINVEIISLPGDRQHYAAVPVVEPRVGRTVDDRTGFEVTEVPTMELYQQGRFIELIYRDLQTRQIRTPADAFAPAVLTTMDDPMLTEVISAYRGTEQPGLRGTREEGASNAQYMHVFTEVDGEAVTDLTLAKADSAQGEPLLSPGTQLARIVQAMATAAAGNTRSMFSYAEAPADIVWMRREGMTLLRQFMDGRVTVNGVEMSADRKAFILATFQALFGEENLFADFSGLTPIQVADLEYLRDQVRTGVFGRTYINSQDVQNRGRNLVAQGVDHTRIAHALEILAQIARSSAMGMQIRQQDEIQAGGFFAGAARVAERTLSAVMESVRNTFRPPQIIMGQGTDVWVVMAARTILFPELVVEAKQWLIRYQVLKAISDSVRQNGDNFNVEYDKLLEKLREAASSTEGTEFSGLIRALMAAVELRNGEGISAALDAFRFEGQASIRQIVQPFFNAPGGNRDAAVALRREMLVSSRWYQIRMNTLASDRIDRAFLDRLLAEVERDRAGIASASLAREVFGLQLEDTSQLYGETIGFQRLAERLRQYLQRHPRISWSSLTVEGSDAEDTASIKTLLSGYLRLKQPFDFSSGGLSEAAMERSAPLRWVQQALRWPMLTHLGGYYNFLTYVTSNETENLRGAFTAARLMTDVQQWNHVGRRQMIELGDRVREGYEQMGTQGILLNVHHLVLAEMLRTDQDLQIPGSRVFGQSPRARRAFEDLFFQWEGERGHSPLHFRPEYEDHFTFAGQSPEERERVKAQFLAAVQRAAQGRPEAAERDWVAVVGFLGGGRLNDWIAAANLGRAWDASTEVEMNKEQWTLRINPWDQEYALLWPRREDAEARRTPNENIIYRLAQDIPEGQFLELTVRETPQGSLAAGIASAARGAYGDRVNALGHALNDVFSILRPHPRSGFPERTPVLSPAASPPSPADVGSAGPIAPAPSDVPMTPEARAIYNRAVRDLNLAIAATHDPALTGQIIRSAEAGVDMFLAPISDLVRDAKNHQLPGLEDFQARLREDFCDRLGQCTTGTVSRGVFEKLFDVYFYRWRYGIAMHFSINHGMPIEMASQIGAGETWQDRLANSIGGAAMSLIPLVIFPQWAMVWYGDVYQKYRRGDWLGALIELWMVNGMTMHITNQAGITRYGSWDPMVRFSDWAIRAVSSPVRGGVRAAADHIRAARGQISPDEVLRMRDYIAESFHEPILLRGLESAGADPGFLRRVGRLGVRWVIQGPMTRFNTWLNQPGGESRPRIFGPLYSEPGGGMNIPRAFLEGLLGNPHEVWSAYVQNVAMRSGGQIGVPRTLVDIGINPFNRGQGLVVQGGGAVAVRAGRRLERNRVTGRPARWVHRRVIDRGVDPAMRDVVRRGVVRPAVRAAVEGIVSDTLGRYAPLETDHLPTGEEISFIPSIESDMTITRANRSIEESSQRLARRVARLFMQRLGDDFQLPKTAPDEVRQSIAESERFAGRPEIQQAYVRYSDAVSVLQRAGILSPTDAQIAEAARLRAGDVRAFRELDQTEMIDRLSGRVREGYQHFREASRVLSEERSAAGDTQPITTDDIAARAGLETRDVELYHEVDTMVQREAVASRRPLYRDAARRAYGRTPATTGAPPTGSPDGAPSAGSTPTAKPAASSPRPIDEWFRVEEERASASEPAPARVEYPVDGSAALRVKPTPEPAPPPRPQLRLVPPVPVDPLSNHNVRLVGGESAQFGAGATLETFARMLERRSIGYLAIADGVSVSGRLRTLLDVLPSGRPSGRALPGGARPVYRAVIVVDAQTAYSISIYEGMSMVREGGNFRIVDSSGQPIQEFRLEGNRLVEVSTENSSPEARALRRDVSSQARRITHGESVIAETRQQLQRARAQVLERLDRRMAQLEARAPEMEPSALEQRRQGLQRVRGRYEARFREAEARLQSTEEILTARGSHMEPGAYARQFLREQGPMALLVLGIDIARNYRDIFSVRTAQDVGLSTSGLAVGMGTEAGLTRLFRISPRGGARFIPGTVAGGVAAAVIETAHQWEGLTSDDPAHQWFSAGRVASAGGKGAAAGLLGGAAGSVFCGPGAPICLGLTMLVVGGVTYFGLDRAERSIFDLDEAETQQRLELELQGLGIRLDRPDHDVQGRDAYFGRETVVVGGDRITMGQAMAATLSALPEEVKAEIRKAGIEKINLRSWSELTPENLMRLASTAEQAYTEHPRWSSGGVREARLTVEFGAVDHRIYRDTFGDQVGVEKVTDVNIYARIPGGTTYSRSPMAALVQLAHERTEVARLQINELQTGNPEAIDRAVMYQDNAGDIWSYDVLRYGLEVSSDELSRFGNLQEEIRTRLLLLGYDVDEVSGEDATGSLQTAIEAFAEEEGLTAVVRQVRADGSTLLSINSDLMRRLLEKTDGQEIIQQAEHNAAEDRARQSLPPQVSPSS